MNETNETGQGGRGPTMGGDPRSRWCRHYTGAVGEQRCRAGIPYAGQVRPLPCINFSQQPNHWGQCPSFSEYSSAELDEQDRVRNERLRAYFTDLLADRCPHCGHAIEQRVQVGRSVYADPCGHRLYQGRV